MTTAHVYRQRLGLLLADVAAFLIAFVVGMHLRFTADLGWFEPGIAPWEAMLQALPIMLAVWLGTQHGCGGYAGGRRGFLEEAGRVIGAGLLFTAILASVTFFYRGFSYSRGFAILFLGLLLSLELCFRAGLRVVRAHLDDLESLRSRVLLIGASPVATHLAERSGQPDTRLFVLGVLDDQRPLGEAITDGVAVVGRVADLADRARELGAHGVIVTSSSIDQAGLLAIYDVCLARNLEWHLVPSAYELMLDRVTFDIIAGVPVLGTRRSNIRGGNRLIKRALDVVVATIALLLFAPVMLFVAIAIKLSSKGPILFTQERVGENGEHFRFLKFRTMHTGNNDAIHREYIKKWIAEGKAASADGKGQIFKIERDPRLIPIGAFLRKYSIDELPQLFNVLRGDMSLIGPRPPIPYEVEVYREWHRRRFEGPPGITGLWQVSGRNRLSFDEMVKLDIQYLENWSLTQDLRILWRTMGVVLFDRAF